MDATAYSAEDPGCGPYTARGSRVAKGLVAVDPGVIPLGTRLYITGYGPAVADDTGGAIHGQVIDLAFNSRSEALQFGRRQVTVYILE
jgi:3D (Asp-Asp-Asp) domain-containing protein